MQTDTLKLKILILINKVFETIKTFRLIQNETLQLQEMEFRIININPSMNQLYL